MGNVSIIIPTYNEKDNIELMVCSIEKQLAENLKEIIVVDDNSPDKTWQVVAGMQKDHKRLRLLRRIGRRGLTSAFREGIQKSKGEIIGWLDGDLSHPPSLLSKMLSCLSGHDVVVASRYVRGGQDARGQKAAVLFSKAINKLAQIFIAPTFLDYTSGYILFKKKLLGSYRLNGDYGEYFIDLMTYFIGKKYKIKEIPYLFKSRKYGQSKTAANWFDFLAKGRKYIVIIWKCRQELKKASFR